MRDKVAQLVIGVTNGDVFSTQSDDYKKYRHWVRDLHIGGFIVNNDVEFGSARNANPYAMSVFLNQMQRMSKLPLLIGSTSSARHRCASRGRHTIPAQHGLRSHRRSQHLKIRRPDHRPRSPRPRRPLVFAPVADVNNNPKNPVINIRSLRRRSRASLRARRRLHRRRASGPGRPLLVHREALSPATATPMSIATTACPACRSCAIAWKRPS